MGEAELIRSERLLIIRSIFYFYGDESTPELATQVAQDIRSHWNEPQGHFKLDEEIYHVLFQVEGIHAPDLAPEKVWYNDDPRLNFFRIEKDVVGNISFVDAIGSNTGYLKLDNLLQTSTTAAHEYGHTLGLVHPKNLDARGIPVPCIMYPRGTLCDPHLQYDPLAKASAYGGCLNPIHRRVLECDIDALKLHKLDFDDTGKAVVGEFSSMYHAKHVPADFQ